MMETVISSISSTCKVNINSRDYRGITLSSALGKVFDFIIISRCSDDLSSSDVQFAFKPKHSIVIYTAVMKEIISRFTKRGNNVCFLDATKTFDKANFPKLFQLLRNRNMPSIAIVLQRELDHRKHQSSASLAFVGEFTGEFPTQRASNAEKCLHLMMSSCEKRLFV